MAETSSARFQNRRAMLDKEHALNTARNPGDSKYGNALYRNNTHEGRVYSAELTRIDKQLKITSMHIDQAKKQFLAKYAPKEPMLIVMRPPSPKAIQKHEWTQHNLENDYAYGHPKYRGGPRYMDPLKSRVRTPNYRPTIDAFCVQTRKKVNVWEKELVDKEPPKFRSMATPSYPLSTAEVRDLIKALEYHRLAMDEARRRRPKRRGNRKQKAPTPRAIEPSASAGTPWQFVTDVTSNAGAAVEESTPTGKQSRIKTAARGDVDEQSAAVTFDLENDGRFRKKAAAKDNGNGDVKRPLAAPSTTSGQRHRAIARKPMPRRTKEYSNDRPNNAFKKLSTSATCLVSPGVVQPVVGLPPSHSGTVPQKATTETSTGSLRQPTTVQEESKAVKGQRETVDETVSGTSDDGHDKTKSGMALILEAALNGMNSPAPDLADA